MYLIVYNEFEMYVLIPFTHSLELVKVAKSQRVFSIGYHDFKNMNEIK